MDEKFMKVLREQQEIQQKAARILHDTEKMKEEVQNKLESLKRKVENDFKNIGEFLKEANVQFATYEYIFQEDDCKRIQINEQKYQTCIYVVVNQHKIYLGPSKAEDESCFHFLYQSFGQMAIHLAVKPVASFTFGKPQKISEPVGGTCSRLRISSI